MPLKSFLTQKLDFYMTLFLTEDGSHSVYSEQLGVSYHSKHGAIQETQHVFIKAGLDYILQQSPLEINILEIGFGTGLNAFMTFLESESQPIHTTINYFTVEAYPLSMEQVIQLNYVEQLDARRYEDIFLKIHSSEWSEVHPLSKKFNFQKLLINFEDIDFHDYMDLIYFDAFAPDVQPQLWEQDLMTKMFNALRSQGVLTTYCAKGVVKRTLKSVGFIIESLPGPPGKREMTRAIKK